MAQATAPQRKGMGPGFWPVTVALTVINIAISIFLFKLDFSTLIPEMGQPADAIDALTKFMAIVGNALFVYVAGYLVFFAIAWRRRKSDPPDAIGIQIHDNHTLELWWTIVPTILVVIIAVFSIRIWATLQNQTGNALTMEAIGHQFKYEFRYPGLKQSVYDEMHLPVGQPVTVQVTAADVIHSFWIPEVRLKSDMVPGLVQSVRFTPQHVGKYHVICTEFCGSQHANMAATLYVDSVAGFTWLTAQAKSQNAASSPSKPLDLAAGNATAGQQLFGQKCASCHNAAGGFDQKIVGPGLAHLGKDPGHPYLVTGKPVDAAGIAYILVNGYQGADESNHASGPSIGVMPNRQANGLSDGDIANLTSYLLSMAKK